MVSLKDIILVHVTSVKPSVSDDGSSLVLKTGGSYFDSLEYKDDGRIIAGNRDFSRPYRVTLHWSTNGVTRAAGAKINGECHYGVSARYVVLEPILALRHDLWGGRFDDFYSIGDHTLSKDAIILVPQNEEGLFELSKFVTVWTMEGVPEHSGSENLRPYVEDLLSKLGKPVMQFNGPLLTGELLSCVLCTSLPDRWDSMNAQEVFEDEEFKQKCGHYVVAIIDFENDTRMFVARDVDHRLDATFAYFQIPPKYDSSEGLFFEDMRKMLKEESFFLPEIDVLHPDSRINLHGQFIAKTYKTKDIEKRRKCIQTLKTDVENRFLSSKRNFERSLGHKKPSNGFYAVLNRMEETLIMSPSQEREYLA